MNSSDDTRRFHRIIEQQVDIFVDVCKKHVEDKGLTKVWVIKDEEASLVSIGNPDKLQHNKDFGFSMYYETIVFNLDEAVNEFLFKLNHFIKVAQATDRYSAFKNGKTQ